MILLRLQQRPNTLRGHWFPHPDKGCNIRNLRAFPILIVLKFRLQNLVRQCNKMALDSIEVSCFDNTGQNKPHPYTWMSAAPRASQDIIFPKCRGLNPKVDSEYKLPPPRKNTRYLLCCSAPGTFVQITEIEIKPRKHLLTTINVKSSLWVLQQ